MTACPNCNHVHTPCEDSAALRRIERKLDLLLKKENLTMTTLATLTADVAAEKTVDDSAIALLQGLKAQLDAAGTDPVALAALSSSLEAEQAALSAAVVANTPAAPAA